MNKDPLEEYTLPCGKRMSILKKDADYFKSNLTTQTQACSEICPNTGVKGRIFFAPFNK